MNLISFLGKRFKRFFSSGQKVPTSKFRWLILMGVLCIAPWQEAEAASDWDRYWNTFKWNEKTGCIEYKVRYFQTWGGGGDKGHCGFEDDENPTGFVITQNTPKKVSYQINCNYDGVLKMTANVPGDYKNYITHQKYSDEDEHIMEWSQPITSNDLNKDFTINMKGVWWREGSTKDQKIDETWSSGLRTTVQTANYTSIGGEFVSSSNQPAVKISWEREISNRNCGSWGDIDLYEDNRKMGSDETHIKENYNTKGDFVLNVDEAFLEKSHKFKVHQEYFPTKNNQISYITESADYVLKAYPQVQRFFVKVDTDKKAVSLKWEISSVMGSDYNDSPFLLTIKNLTVDTTKVIEIAYDPKLSSYESFMDLKDGDKSQYYFSIERKATRNISGWEKFKKEQKISVNTNYPQNASAQFHSKDKPYVEIKWDQDGAIWTTGSELKLVRTNETTSVVEEFNLNYEEGIYKDELLRFCNSYSYVLKMIPGSDRYKQKSIALGSSVKPSKVGSISDFNVSKGYYSDRVNLKWKATDDVDEILVERREVYGSDTAFRKIETVNATVNSDLSYDDNSCLPGILYEYRIYGLKECGGEKLYTKEFLKDFGFRTPTGDFYGHITFENGQGVDSVTVRLEADGDLETYALSLNGTGKVEIPGKNILADTSAVTLQAWVYPSSSENNALIINKKDIFKVAFKEGHFLFIVGDNDTIKAKSESPLYTYTHVSAVYDQSTSQAYIYLNGELSAKATIENVSFRKDLNGDVVLGENFEGEIDEVRLWSRALSKSEILADYTRYLIGNEKNLDAYYTFDFMSDDQIYDSSFEGKATYHGNTGINSNVHKVKSHLSSNSLSYCSVTDSSGVYNIRSVPYYGNGTAYTIIPRKGSHQFSPKQEIRFIGEGAQHHTVNFTDNSSFEVTGYVYYSGGNYPVEGVHFTIDGAIALNKSGQYIKTEADGSFSINVPVGIHEVKAVKDGHTFELDGRICNSDGSDRNYQDIITEIKLYDNTKVKYIGRICGGEVQEAFPVGFSLSKNNLANDMKIVLKPTQKKYKLQSVSHTEKVSHPILKGTLARVPKTKAKTTSVEYNTDNITIHVNNETGEFIAWVYPIEYTVSLSVYGHEGITGDKSSLNLSPYKVEQFEKYEYVDSVYTNGINDKEGYKKVSYVDSIG